MADPVLRVLICGSVDDGKSTLIGRLLLDTGSVPEDHLLALEHESRPFGGTGGPDLAFLTDGLLAEREQGITIDVAWRTIERGGRRLLLADAPGHVQHTRNMATAASSCGTAVVVVDASRGPLTQTRRHVAIAQLLGVERFVFAINKMDLVDFSEERFRTVAQECDAGLASASHVEFVPVVASDGDNIVRASDRLGWWGGGTLEEAILRGASNAPRIDRPLRFPVQLVVRGEEGFRGYAGTVASGTVHPGDLLELPSGTTGRVARIVTFDGDQQAASEGAAVALTFEDEVDIRRGDLLAHADAAPTDRPVTATVIDGTLIWLERRPLSGVGRLELHGASGRTPMRVREIRGEVDIDTGKQHPTSDVGMNAVARVVVETERGVLFDPYERFRATGGFTVVERSTGDVVAAFLAERGTSRSAASVHRVSAVRADVRAARFGHGPAMIRLSGDPVEAAELTGRLENRLVAFGALVTRLGGSAVHSTDQQGLAQLLIGQGQLVLATPAASPATPTGTVVLDLWLPGEVDPTAVVPLAAAASEDGATIDLGERAVALALKVLHEHAQLRPAPPRPVTVWLTGLSGAGKTTVGRSLQASLEAVGCPAVLLDGDELRAAISADLGFSMRDRAEQTLRAGRLARATNDSGRTAIVALMSPVRSAREEVRALHVADSFIEVHMAAPLEVCEQRDPKGLYRKARAGMVRDMTGIDLPYEVPDDPEVVLASERTVSESVDLLIGLLLRRPLA